VTQQSSVVTTGVEPASRRSHAIFGAAKYESSGRPVNSPRRGAWARSARAIVSERRSCQQIAGPSGSPVFGLHASTVSPWLPSPTAETFSPAAPRARRPAWITESSSSLGSWVTLPSDPATGVSDTWPSPSTTPPSEMTTALVAEVPWSMARTFIGRAGRRFALADVARGEPPGQRSASQSPNLDARHLARSRRSPAANASASSSDSNVRVARYPQPAVAT
jgi:hypothetical protein